MPALHGRSSLALWGAERCSTRLDDADYHSKRSLHELHFGLTSPNAKAAEAHLTLSSLHMQRARDAKDAEDGKRTLYLVD